MAGSRPPVPTGPLADAMALHERGKLNPAKKLYREFLALQPRHPDALELLGLVHAELGEIGDAVRVLEQAVAVKPDSINAVFNLGMALRRQQKHAEAETWLRKAVVIAPMMPQAHFQLGAALFAQGKAGEAETCFRESLRQSAKQPNAHFNLAQTLVMQGRLREAVAEFNTAATLDPKSAEPLWELGRTLLSMVRVDRAVDVLNRATNVEPKSSVGWTLLGTALMMSERTAEAVVALERAHALDKEDHDALFELIAAKRQLADWQGLDRLEKLAARLASRQIGHATSLHTISLLDDPASHRIATRAATAGRWPTRAATDDKWRLANTTERPKAERRDGRIRVAYVMAGLPDIPAGRSITGLIAAHDRKAFEIHVVTTMPDDDGAVATKLGPLTDSVLVAAEMPAAAFAAHCRAHGIDIAVDLRGHFAGGRPELFANRSAPVQVSFLGFPATTGLQEMDYLVADAQAIPPGSDDLYDERIVRLPGCYLPNNLSLEAPDTTATRLSVGLPDDALVLCAPAAAGRITADVFAVWMRLLTQIPGSVLWLPRIAGSAADNLRSAAMRADIQPVRLVFGGTAQVADVGAVPLHLADLVLDCAPCAGHTPAAEAIWTGVPLVTLAGVALPSRMSSSALHAAGLDELVTTSLAGYEETARSLATDAVRRARLKQSMIAARTASPLFDMPRFARGLEWAYMRMVEAAVAGRTPEAITVPDSSGGR